ncbi:TPA: hypothetical protein SLN68_002500 [Serratia marcescens]|nr:MULTISPECIES: hypothetical protein [Serratia]ELL0335308.1 hypothetical protein [Serratia marcescens]MBH2552535.1 hypothetical protein [Serratia marcescens]MBH2565096.1 hypothetical protein [Serratia marcescens]MBH2834496.1 hypothetical protein [Serratia marcescens]MBH2861311.1 hypothetical protein [Serratia marcescens]
MLRTSFFFAFFFTFP